MKPQQELNRLSREKSPYLLQHAANPVDWYPWSEEAFDKARREDKPVFLSIGYSTCHWCHVMEEESFENEMIAKYLNDHFVSIKVDREERPDVDHIYMSAVQAMTGQGGWPLSVFLTPDRKPFFGGTYFPPYAKWGSPGFFDVLASIEHGWRNEREKMLNAGNALTGMLKEHLPGGSGDASLTKDIFEQAYTEFRQTYDDVYGGFGHAPKFPTSHNLSFLLRYTRRAPDSRAQEMVAFTLHRMAAGGMYDHLGGGFHRYSTDREWQIPHFEKMLYDQAILGRTYVEMYQLTGDSFYARVARETFDYCLRDLRDAQGAFHSAEDADSLDPYEFAGMLPDPAQKHNKKEGAFFLWQSAQIDDVLSQADAGIFKCYYGIRPDGNAKSDPHGEFGGRNVLAQAEDLQACAAQLGVSVEDVSASLQRTRQALFPLREERPRPHLDDKVLVDWNGLMIGALAFGGRVLEEPRYLQAAEEAARFILANMLTDGHLLHRYRDGESSIPGMLEDYAFFINALIDLYEATFDPLYIEKAVALQAACDESFADKVNGGYYLTAEGADDLIYRPKEIYDGAIPSGNSMAALALVRLYHITFDKKYLDRAQKLFASFAGTVRKRPSAFAQMLMAFDFAVGPSAEIVIAGAREDAGVRDMSDEVFRSFIPNRVLIHRDSDPRKGEALWELVPFLEKQPPVDGRPTAYVCENAVCQRPVTDLPELKKILENLVKEE
ncbi:MAG: thioredoxin domain-containing protein [Candidatus Omnitrophica bacterium]|nr:thioredoxin domain-containing protein [Candidatus Omnitrophota bacterium]